MVPAVGSNQPVYSCQVARIFQASLPYSSVNAVNGPLQEASGKYPQTDATAAALPLLGPSELHAGVIIAPIVCVALWFMLYRTTEGLRLRATVINGGLSRSPIG